MKVEAITLFVADPQRSKAFYSAAFDTQPIFGDDNSVVFRLENLVVNLLDGGAPAEELVAPANAGRGDARSVLTIGVEDVDAACAALGQRGIELLNGPLDRPWGIRTASFRDPDGHIWELAA